jgi:DNA replication protein DnaC
LLSAKHDLRLEKELRRLDGYAVVILDDIGYLQQNRDEGRKYCLPSSPNAMSAKAR